MSVSDKVIKQLEEADKNNRLNMSIADFIERYAPADPREAAYFNAHLHEIVRAIYADMTAPVQRALTATLNVAMPHLPISGLETKEK